MPLHPTKLNHIYYINTYMYKEDNLKGLICHKTQPNQILYIYIYIDIHVCVCVCVYVCMYKEVLTLNNLQWFICHKTKPNQILYI